MLIELLMLLAAIVVIALILYVVDLILRRFVPDQTVRVLVLLLVLIGLIVFVWPRLGI